MKQILQHLFIDFLLVVPAIVIIHELGHVFFIKIFGGDIKKCVLGTGKKITQFGIFEIKKYFFLGVAIEFKKVKKNKKLNRLLIILGGTFFNIATAVIISFLISKDIIKENILLFDLKKYSLYASIYNMIPFPNKGVKSDGKQFLEIIKNNNI